MSAYGMFFPRMVLPVLLALLISPAVLPIAGAHAQSQGQVVITNRYANLRSGPGTKFQRLGRVNQGERFPLSQVRPEWYGIIFRGRETWVFAPLARVEQAGPSEAEMEHLRSQVESLDNRVERITDKMERVQQALLDRVEQTAPSPPPFEPQAAIPAPMVDVMPSYRAVAHVSPAWALIPGAPRIKVGNPVRGWSLFGLTAGCAVAGTWAWLDYRDRRDEYRALPAGSPFPDFDRLHGRAKKRRDLALGLLYGTAGLYAFNIVDYFLFLPKPGIEVRSDGEGERINLSLTCEF